MSTDLESQVRGALRDAVAGRTSSADAWSRLAARRARSVHHRRTTLLMSTAAATVAAVIAVSVVAQDDRGRNPQPIADPASTAAAPNSSASLSSSASVSPSDAITATIKDVGANTLVSIGGDVWAADSNAGELIRVSAADNRIVSRHPVGPGTRPAAIGLVAGSSSLWTFAGALQRVDPVSGKTTTTVAAGDGDNGHGLAYGEGFLWAVCCNGQSLQQIDLAAGRVVSTSKFDVQVPEAGVAVGHGAVWVNAAGGGEGVVRYDPATKADTTTSLRYAGGNAQGNIAVTDDAVWAETGDALVRIDPASREVTATVSLPPTSTVFDMAGAGGTLWVVGNKANRLWRIDSKTAQITGVVDVRTPQAVLATADAVWVSDGSSLLRIDPSRMRPPEPATDATTFQVEGITAAVPPGWHARSLGTRMVLSRGRPVIQLSTFSFDVTPGAEDPIIAMQPDDILLTIGPDFDASPGAEKSAALALRADDLVNGVGVPVGRSIARHAFADPAGIPFIVEAHFGKPDVSPTDFDRVNAVLSGVHIGAADGAPGGRTSSNSQRATTAGVPESVTVDGPVQIAPILAKEASLPQAQAEFPRLLDLAKAAPDLVREPIDRALALFQTGGDAGVQVLGSDGRLRSLGVSLEPGGDGANKGTALTVGSLRADGLAAAFGQPDGVVVVDLLTGTSRRYEVHGTGAKYAGHSEYIEHISWHPDGKTLFVSGRSAYLLDTATGKLQRTSARGGESAFADDGQLVAFAADGLLHFDPSTGAQLTPTGPRVSVSGYSPPVTRGSRVARGVWHEGGEAIAALDLSSGSVTRLLSFKGTDQGRQDGCCGPVGWLNDDTVIVSTQDSAPGTNRLLVWDVRTGALTRLTELSQSAAASFAHL